MLANMASTAVAMTMVDSQPSARRRREMVSVPMMAGRDAISIIRAMMGTEMTPLMTALHYRALMGSSGEKHRAAPIMVAVTMMP